MERLWRSLKNEDIYLNSYGTLAELQRGVECHFRFYNTERFHQGLDYAIPDQMHQSLVSEEPLPLAGYQ